MVLSKFLGLKIVTPDHKVASRFKIDLIWPKNIKGPPKAALSAPMGERTPVTLVMHK